MTIGRKGLEIVYEICIIYVVAREINVSAAVKGRAQGWRINIDIVPESTFILNCQTVKTHYILRVVFMQMGRRRASVPYCCRERPKTSSDTADGNPTVTKCAGADSDSEFT
ncbi:hypothetical protein EVAR_32840_1 [Eumeta japonica]|uniref:Uncharacterized protein n=1 Tax=Eumeta variegata TaxID=151549 RepID=A0A4C1WAN0_EUMVA|nr:hypothetical protein EVAR_32840_1 [Eumeta japonica]